MLQHIKNRGCYVTVWVLNTDKEFEEALNKFGDSIDGVMTDYPEKLTQFIDA